MESSHAQDQASFPPSSEPPEPSSEPHSYVMAGPASPRPTAFHSRRIGTIRHRNANTNAPSLNHTLETIPGFGCGTRILKYDGSPTAVEDLKVGDLRLGPNGTARKVLRTCKGKGSLYRIKRAMAGKDDLLATPNQRVELFVLPASGLNKYEGPTMNNREHWLQQKHGRFPPLPSDPTDPDLESGQVRYCESFMDALRMALHWWFRYFDNKSYAAKKARNTLNGTPGLQVFQNSFRVGYCKTEYRVYAWGRNGKIASQGKIDTKYDYHTEVFDTKEEAWETALARCEERHMEPRKTFARGFWRRAQRSHRGRFFCTKRGITCSSIGHAAVTK